MRRIKAAMLSCGYRSMWRAMVSKVGGAGDFSYDKFVMPLLCVCGSAVIVGAGIVVKGHGASIAT